VVWIRAHLRFEERSRVVVVAGFDMHLVMMADWVVRGRFLVGEEVTSGEIIKRREGGMEWTSG